MRRLPLALSLALLATACTASHSASRQLSQTSPVASASQARNVVAAPPPAGIPPLVNGNDIYAAGHPGQLVAETRLARPLVYVPNSEDGTVTVIDQQTRQIVNVVRVSRLPQHITPSYDLKTLFVDNDLGNSLTTIDPRTGQFGRTIPVDDPYNLYFTADGRFAVVVAEARQRLDFYDAKTFQLVHRLSLPCPGLDHMDFSQDGTHALASCEFGARMMYVDMQHQSLVKQVALTADSMPQDVKLSPDGRTYYVADMHHGGVFLIDAASVSVLSFLPTGSGAHGLYPSRDSKLLYISNRTGHSISLLSFATRSLVGRWQLPGGTPDMGGLDASGRVLWLSGRYSSEVYAIDTSNGQLLARIAVGRGPHGLCVWPQPGRYSLGHTGILR